MANEEHLAILRQGVAAWNRWRMTNPQIKANLRGANLRGAILRGANLSEADLRGANLSEADLLGAKLQECNLFGTDLFGARLIGAHLTQANLFKADLQRANLQQTHLEKTNFREATLVGSIFTRANLQACYFDRAQMGGTIFAEVDLHSVQGLGSIRHLAPSTIGIDTLYLSKGQIPEAFLRGCGVPDSMIEYARSLVAAERPIDYYSCFISYSSKDEALAERLYADLQARGVRCWYAPHDMQIGEPILSGIDRGIRLHDKLLLILSEASVESGWVEQEVHMALAREKTERRRVLFPIRIDDAAIESRQGWPAILRDTIHIGDFRQWKQHDAYQSAFARLLRDLKAEKA